MKYDDASWHYGGDFPKDLPKSAGATHTGMFLAWALLNGMGSDLMTEDRPRLQSRQITPGAFLMEVCDEKFVNSQLNDEGNAFASSYFNLEKGQYAGDYEATLGKGLSNLYYVEDSWKSYDKLKPVLDRRFREWRGEAEPPKKPWWKLR